VRVEGDDPQAKDEAAARFRQIHQAYEGICCYPWFFLLVFREEELDGFVYIHMLTERVLYTLAVLSDASKRAAYDAVAFQSVPLRDRAKNAFPSRSSPPMDDELARALARRWEKMKELMERMKKVTLLRRSLISRLL
jgi:hypothetical protein